MRADRTRTDESLLTTNPVAEARRVFGDALARTIATGTPPGEATSLFGWEFIDERMETRLRDAIGVARQLLDLEADSTVRAWFVGKNPLLGDRAPALIVAEDPDAVRRAARHFLAYG